MATSASSQSMAAVTTTIDTSVNAAVTNDGIVSTAICSVAIASY
jgi:hypothetical protein